MANWIYKTVSQTFIRGETMRVIIEHEAKDGREWLQLEKGLHSLGPTYKIADLSPEALSAFREKAVSVEEAFSIELVGSQEELPLSLRRSPLMVAYIGVKQQGEVDAYYHLATGEVETGQMAHSLPRNSFISCYSKTNRCDASQYLRCIQFLIRRATQFHQPLLIYTAIQIPLAFYRYRTLTFKMINNWIKETDAMVVATEAFRSIYVHYTPQVRAFEPYEEEGLYVEEGFKEAVERAGHLLIHYRKAKEVRREYYKEEVIKGKLYEDVFYNQLPVDTPLSIALGEGALKPSSFYEEKGFKVIEFEGKPIALQGIKENYEKHGESLKPLVVPQFKVSLLSELQPNREKELLRRPYSVLGDRGVWSGEGVCIGVITTGQVDASHEAFKDEQGKSRLVYLWQQEEKEEKPVYPERTPSETTFLLGIAGGYSKDYQGIAPKAEFLVAQIKPAPLAVQRVYGGNTSQGHVELLDVLSGMLKLVEWAKERHKPLVLCLPFEGPLISHGGKIQWEEYFSKIGKKLGCTIVVSAGEEGNKGHHQCLLSAYRTYSEATIEVKKEGQSWAMQLRQQGLAAFKLSLFSKTTGELLFFDMQQAGEQRGETGAYCLSRGLQRDEEQGGSELLLNIGHLPKGEWQLRVERKEGRHYPLEVWLASQSFNPFIKLQSPSPFQTLNPLAHLKHVISVGAYDAKSDTLLGSSGRGKREEFPQKPLVVAPALDELAPCKRGWERVDGTLVATGLIGGVVANLYSGTTSQWNSLLMSQRLLEWQSLRQGETYPYLGHQAPFLEKKVLQAILKTPCFERS